MRVWSKDNQAGARGLLLLVRHTTPPEFSSGPWLKTFAGGRRIRSGDGGFFGGWKFGWGMIEPLLGLGWDVGLGFTYQPIALEEQIPCLGQRSTKSEQFVWVGRPSEKRLRRRTLLANSASILRMFVRRGGGGSVWRGGGGEEEVRKG